MRCFPTCDAAARLFNGVCVCGELELLVLTWVKGFAAATTGAGSGGPGFQARFLTFPQFHFPYAFQSVHLQMCKFMDLSGVFLMH